MHVNVGWSPFKCHGRELRGTRPATQQEDMQISLSGMTAQLFEEIDAGDALLQRTSIETRGDKQRDSIWDYQVGMRVNILQPSILLQ